jgi:siroheme synthase (precorrin-2 oxidase/ferrochelatase)
MKVQFINNFHQSDYTTNVKNSYIDRDPIANLEYEVYSKGKDANYAKRKLKEIQSHLCGVNCCLCCSFMKTSK